MNSFYFDLNGTTYKRVNRIAALKAFKAGSGVILLPCKMNPVCKWYNVTPLTYKDMIERHDPIEKDPASVFNTLCNNAIYYNCNSETGNYLSYYIAA